MMSKIKTFLKRKLMESNDKTFENHIFPELDKSIKSHSLDVKRNSHGGYTVR